MIARYIDSNGHVRELLARPGAAGSVLVVDRDAATLGDVRLVGHLGAEEPAANAERLCRLYLADPTRGRCRPLSGADLRTAPDAETDLACESRGAGERGAPEDGGPGGASGAKPLRCEGRLYRLRAAPNGPGRARQLRWCVARRPAGPWTPLGLREVIASFERYEPMRSLTASALADGCPDTALTGRRPATALAGPRSGATLAGRRPDATVATATLRGELRRLQASAMVLNRGLREAVLRAVEERGLSLSEIALRCGKVKRDRQGRVSGQTSWLTRRIGLAPEAGSQRTVRWVHSDVLALIARRGLGVSPREVEIE